MPVVTVSAASVALTTKRVILFRPKSPGLGMSFEDFHWMHVPDIHISESILGATFIVRAINGRSSGIDSLPKAPARKLYQFGQQMEERANVNRW